MIFTDFAISRFRDFAIWQLQGPLYQIAKSEKSPDESAFGAPDEFDKVTHLGIVGQLRLDFCECIFQLELGPRQPAIGSLQGLDCFLRKTLALQADGVDAVCFCGPVSDGLHKRKRILCCHGVAAQESVFSDSTPLMNGTERADGGVISDLNMPGQGSPIHEKDVRSHLAVMTHMCINHQIVVRADASHSAAT